MNQDNNFNQGINVNQQAINSQPQPINTFDGSNANNSNFNGKRSKKINLGLVIGIVAVVAVVGVGLVFGSKLLSNGGSDNNSNNDSNSNINESNNAGNNNVENNNNSKDWDTDGEWSPNNGNGSSKYYIDLSTFTAYATKLKSNGAYAWWIVYYDSDNGFENSNLDSASLDSKYALPIAKSFREEK